jgi:hypothetical protein
VDVNYLPKGKRHRAQFKFKVALEAAKGRETLPIKRRLTRSTLQSVHS